MFNPLKIFINRKVGLVLGSGGAKGISHIAVIEYLKRMKIPINMVAGTSIGALVGAVYAAGKLDELKKDMLTMGKKEFLEIFDPILPISGLIGTDSIVKLLKRYIPGDLRIEDLSIPFAAVATDYYSGRAVVFRSGSVLEAVRASISIPGVFPPVPYKETILLDGGVVNPLPIDVIKEMGAGLTIAVNLHPYFKTKRGDKAVKQKIVPDIVSTEKKNTKKDSWADNILDITKSFTEKARATWMKLIFSEPKENKINIPNIFETLFQTVDIMGYTSTYMMLRYNPPTVVIEPHLMDFGSLEFHRCKEALSEGIIACDKQQFALKSRIKWWV